MGSSIYTLVRIGLLALLCMPSIAVGVTVGLVVESQSQQAVSFHAQLKKLSPDHTIALYSIDNLPKAEDKGIHTWMAMGPKALAVLLGRTNGSDRILGLFVKEKAKTKLKKLYPNKQFSILENRPTLDRQMALIKVLNPQAKKVAIYHSTQYPELPKSLKAMAKALNLSLEISELKDPLNWDRNALKALKDADLVLGLDDGAIYNATTIRSILMRLYRASRPLIGPDKGYVRAGAVASTFSGVKETLKAIVDLLGQQGEWPAVIYNPYFSVSINTQVARSLNITVGNPEQVKEEVKGYLP